jgi:hypothetical protein
VFAVETTVIPAPRPEPPLQAARQALRRYLRPFLLIQAAAVLLVIAYRTSAPVRALCAALVELRQAGGLPFAALASAIAGGLLPEVASLATLGSPSRLGRWRQRRAAVAFNIAFFALNGVVIDLFYRLSARIFGPTATFDVVVAKVAFDQMVFSPLWLSVIAALFVWQRHGFRLAPTRADLAQAFLRRRLLPLLLPNLCFWVPMTSIIYALPVPLQFLLFVLALAAWSLIMVFIAAR